MAENIENNGCSQRLEESTVQKTQLVPFFV